MSVKKVGFANRIFVLLLTLCIAMSSLLFWSVQTHAEDEIPAYDGNATVELNKNAPGFTKDEITTKSFESYGDLDKLGRCTTATADSGRSRRRSGQDHVLAGEPSFDAVQSDGQLPRHHAERMGGRSGVLLLRHISCSLREGGQPFL